jgi:hypothetical protein
MERVQVQDPGKNRVVGQSSGKDNPVSDEVLKLIKRSKYKIVD